MPRKKVETSPSAVSFYPEESFRGAPAQPLAEHLARLQQRHQAMMAETTRELDELRQQIEENSEALQLRQAIQELQQENALLREQLALTTHQANEQYRALAGTVDTLRTRLHTQLHALDQNFRLFTQDSSDNLEAILASLEGGSAPTFNQSAPVPPSHTPHPAPAFEISPPVVKTPPAQPKPAKKRRHLPHVSVRRLATRTVTLSLVVSCGYFGWHFLTASHPADAAQVAGVSTQAAEPSSDPYSESFAEVPFDKTVWDSFTDTDFGIRLDYPKNASNKVRVIGGSNLWFLRKNGYLLKVSRLDDGTDLDAWWNANKQNYSDSDDAIKTTFKNHPAWYVSSKAKTVTSGSSYFIAYNGGMFQFWVKDEPATTDDGQRLTRMIDSLTFLN